MDMATDKPRYTVSVTNEMFEAIEDFRFKNRYQTRSEATAELIRLGLEQLKKEEGKTDEKNTASDAKAE
jgi:metal-responsive CopG/Arc/MetJ family transcriptional regulator